MFKIKYSWNRSIKQYKRKFIAQNFFQIYGINYKKIFLLINWKKMLRSFFTPIAFFDLFFNQINIIKTYFKNLLDYNIFFINIL